MTLPGLLTDPPDDGPYLPVLNDLSVSGYCDFQGALSQARYMAAMSQHDAEDPDLPDDERQFAARTAIGQQATI